MNLDALLSGDNNPVTRWSPVWRAWRSPAILSKRGSPKMVSFTMAKKYSAPGFPVIQKEWQSSLFLGGLGGGAQESASRIDPLIGGRRSAKAIRRP